METEVLVAGEFDKSAAWSRAEEGGRGCFRYSDGAGKEVGTDELIFFLDWRQYLDPSEKLVGHAFRILVVQLPRLSCLYRVVSAPLCGTDRVMLGMIKETRKQSLRSTLKWP